LAKLTFGGWQKKKKSWREFNLANDRKQLNDMIFIWWMTKKNLILF